MDYDLETDVRSRLHGTRSRVVKSLRTSDHNLHIRHILTFQCLVFLSTWGNVSGFSPFTLKEIDIFIDYSPDRHHNGFTTGYN